MRILIPTRNSANWIAHFADGYRALGVRPFYLVDERSDDSTIDVLRSRNEDFATCLPYDDYVESGMIEAGAAVIDDDWILRLDDDEFPCAPLARLPAEILDPKAIYGMMRHEAILAEDRVTLARWPAVLCGDNGLVGLSRQYRLFNRRFAQYDGSIHSPGVKTTKQKLLHEFFHMTHFNCVLRSPAQRLDKIRSYAARNLETSYRVAEESLPELRKPCKYELREITDRVTLTVAESLPKAKGRRPIFNRRERALRRTLLLRDAGDRTPLADCP